MIKKNYEINNQNFFQNNVSQKEVDAISALMNLGYSQLNSSQVIAKVIDASNKELDVEDIIRLSLKTLVSKG